MTGFPSGKFELACAFEHSIRHETPLVLVDFAIGVLNSSLLFVG